MGASSAVHGGASGRMTIPAGSNVTLKCCGMHRKQLVLQTCKHAKHDTYGAHGMHTAVSMHAWLVSLTCQHTSKACSAPTAASLSTCAACTHTVQRQRVRSTCMRQRYVQHRPAPHSLVTMLAHGDTWEVCCVASITPMLQSTTHLQCTTRGHLCSPVWGLCLL
jgi:hypothetical protein